jgi:hypothetical protein
MGYVEETGSAQHYRDARITTIYEGTTGIQANDLVGRKTLANGGEVVADLLRDITAVADDLRRSDALSGMGDALHQAVTQASDACQWILDHAAEDPHAAGAASVNYLMLMGYVCGGWLMGRSALRATALLESGQGDRSFLEAKQATSRFYFEHMLPRAGACLVSIRAGSGAMMALAEDQF